MEIKQNSHGWWQLRVNSAQMKQMPYFFKRTKRILPPFILTDKFQNLIDELGAFWGRDYDNEWYIVVSFKNEIDLISLRLLIS